MNATATIWTPQGEICRQCGRLVGGIIDRAKRLRASLGTLFAQGSYTQAGGEVVKPLSGGVGAGIVGDTADCGVCPCGGGGSAPTCDCGTCSGAMTTRGIHLLGFDGPGTCSSLPSGVNYYKVLGTIDVSLNLDFISYTSTFPCTITWGDNLSQASGLTVYYYRDSICTVPMSVAGGHTSEPLIITRVSATFSCSILDPVTELFGPGWVVQIWLTDTQFFNTQLTLVLPNPGTACEAGATVPFTPTSTNSHLVGSGSAIIAAG